MAGAKDAGNSTRFKPGQSGNPAGRPRKVKPQLASSAFEELRGRRITVQMDGVDRQLAVDEALIQQTLQDAFAGARMASRTILKMIIEHEAAKPLERRLVTTKFECLTPQSVDEAMLLLGIATKAPVFGQPNSAAILQLEPWAVKTGLAKRKGDPLTRARIADLKTQTRSASDIIWPSKENE